MDIYVINYDQGTIYKNPSQLYFYDDHFETFDEAKEALICYWDNVVGEAKEMLKSSKSLKRKDINILKTNRL
jgi:hypothetical protein